MTHKFNKPCIMDVKIGRKSYDPFASSEKIQQQVSKYPLMEEIGFLVLGMRVRVIFSVIHTFLIACFLEGYRCRIYFRIRLSITPQSWQRFLSLLFTGIWTVSGFILGSSTWLVSEWVAEPQSSDSRNFVLKKF